MSLRREPVAYRKAIRAASLPWNQRREHRAAASTSKLDLPAVGLNSRPKPRTAHTLLAMATRFCETSPPPRRTTREI
jgi:hypothetical protein